MSRLPKAARDYMAQLGSKGGKAKGARKARDPEHYERLAAMKRLPEHVCPTCHKKFKGRDERFCPSCHAKAHKGIPI